MCPVCTIGIAAGLGLSRWLKVDDSISGLWIGALLLALSILTYNWLFRRSVRKQFFILIVIIIAYWALSFYPLHAAGIIDETCKTIWGINRLIFGSLVGLVVAALSLLADKLSRRNRGGKAVFKYQKVIIPISFLLVASFILNAICK